MGRKRSQKRKAHWLRPWVAAASIAYVIAFVGWRVLVASPFFAAWWPLRISEVFGVWAIVPLPFLLFAALMWRRRLALLMLLVPALWFARDYGPQFIPAMSSRVQASGDEDKLRLLTFNSWGRYARNEEFNATVAELQPDIIALQEVNPILANRLGELVQNWPYQERTTVRVVGRMAILSKYPILSVVSDDDWFGCHCAQVVIDWQGQAVRVIVVHIRAPSFGPRLATGIFPVTEFNDTEQMLSYDELLPHIEASAEPLIVLGDFNTTERQEGYRRLYDAGLKDAHQEVGWGLGMTYPAPFGRFAWLPLSVLRIDHLFFDHSWRALDTWTLPLMGSDHQALVVDLQWVGPQ